MKIGTPILLLPALGLSLLGSSAALAQEGSDATPFESAASGIQDRLTAAVAELEALRAELALEKLPLSEELTQLNAELASVKIEHEAAIRAVDGTNLEINKLETRIKARNDEIDFLSNLLVDYGTKFQSRLHVIEDQRYDEVTSAAELAPSNSNLSQEEVFAIQAELIEVSLDRLAELLGGTSFEGEALNADRIVAKGTFVLVGPTALFVTGGVAGTAEQLLNSSEPMQTPFLAPEDQEAAAQLATTGSGFFPLDPTLGKAHKIEATEESFIEHVQKGGPVMVPIFALAGAALLVALYKWLVLSLQRVPSRSKLQGVLDAVASRDEQGAQRAAEAIRGPVGRMLAAGAAHLREPRELIEEVMYETVLTTKLKLQSFLPFVAICAASAPLLGLLGTVTGIIGTFKLITVFGSGDVKSLSSGISEALITTKFGLIVAIPSLLLHAFLSRKARGILDQMEKAALSFLNQVSKTPLAPKMFLDPDAIVQPQPPAEPEPPAAAPKALATAPE
ncbi:MAG: MotA/TolQ/ExbB proton channel family protein [Planctomycetota bacterium]